MVVEKNRVVSIEYELKNAKGDVIDSSIGSDTLEYLHGNQNLIPGLERELEGKKVNDSLTCTIAPADAYGERDDELVFNVPRADFADADKIEVGMQFQAQQPDGVHIVTVVGLSDEEVTVDANHPLAGESLHFAVTVKNIREATEAEISQGHLHGGCDCGCEGDCDDGDCGDGCGCGGCH